MSNTLFQLGDIVALNSHPYTTNQQNIIIGGDSLSLSPLMVITEIQLIKYKEFMGEQKVDGIRYKCQWFSPKSFLFHEDLFTQEQLKLVCGNNKVIVPSQLKRGNIVSFKTGTFEFQKLKSSYSILSDKTKIGDDNILVTPLLSFLPPILQIVDIVINTSNPILKSKKPGSPQKEITYWIAKCIYFDVHNNKAKEVALPIETLELLSKVDESILDNVANTISAKKYFLLTGEAIESTFLKPISISHKYGYYFVRSFDYLSNNHIDILLNETIGLQVVDDIFKEQYPSIDLESHNEIPKTANILKDFSDTIKRSKEKSLYLRITYRNKHDQVTTRTIRDYKRVKLTENDIEITYLVGHCLLRNAVRHFRIDRIEKLQVLNLTFKNG